jgi:hypothetical protein
MSSPVGTPGEARPGEATACSIRLGGMVSAKEDLSHLRLQIAPAFVVLAPLNGV